MPGRGKGKKVMTKAQKAKLRKSSGAAVSQSEMKRFRKAASVVGAFEGVQAGASIGKLHKGKVGKMIGAAAATFGGGLAGAKRGKAAAKKRNKALKRRK